MIATGEPAIDKTILLRRDELVRGLKASLSVGLLVDGEDGRRAYAADPTQANAPLPLAVVLPSTVREISDIMKFCYESGLKVYPRGSGTNLSAGTVSNPDGIVLCLSRMNRIVELHEADRLIRIEAGVANWEIMQATAASDLCYAPACEGWPAATVVGNLMTNAAGTVRGQSAPARQNVVALKVILLDGEVIDLGSGELGTAGYEIYSLFAGSEGLLGIVAEATLRLVPQPSGLRLLLLRFSSISMALSFADAAKSAHPSLSAIELFDRQSIAAIERVAQVGLPVDVDAVLLIEFEGPLELTEAALSEVSQLAQEHRSSACFDSTDVAEIAKIRRAQQSIYATFAGVGPVRCLDVAVPALRLTEALSRINRIAGERELRIAHACSTTQGLVRSVLIGDATDPESSSRITQAANEVAELVMEMGGALAGEHGIGALKRNDLQGELLARAGQVIDKRLKSAFDPEWLLSTGKVYSPPTSPENTFDP